MMELLLLLWMSFLHRTQKEYLYYKMFSIVNNICVYLFIVNTYLLYLNTYLLITHIHTYFYIYFCLYF